MMFRKKSTNQSNPVLTGFINVIFDVFKHFIKDFENMRKVKKIDSVSDNFSTLEHMLVRLEDKIENNRKLIEDLKNRLLWSNVIIIILLALILYGFVA